MKVKALALVMVVLASGCDPPLEPKTAGYCLDSPVAREQANAIRAFVLDEAHRQDLETSDQTDGFRNLEGNGVLVFVLFRGESDGDPFQAQIKINPTYGRSSFTIYGSNTRLPGSTERLLAGLGAQFSFSWENETDGMCARPAEAGSKPDSSR